MSRLLAPLLRRGFPFVVPRVDQWDGVTWYSEGDVEFPSGVSGGHQVICGPGTFYPGPGLTFAQLQRAYFRVKTWRFNVASFPGSSLGANPLLWDAGADLLDGTEPTDGSDHLLGLTTERALVHRYSITSRLQSDTPFDNGFGHIFRFFGGAFTSQIEFFTGGYTLASGISFFDFPPAVKCTQDGLYYPMAIYGLINATTTDPTTGVTYLAGSLRLRLAAAATTPAVFTLDPSTLTWSYSTGDWAVTISPASYWSYSGRYDPDTGAAM